ncbi:hypothetical protein [Chitinophaga sp. CB10]|uniref:hypothetical protein n=1 Tax=Chitinophaga sp. CB10 TaxID=1891659 RepID=UPI0025BDF182|nr:hypothetical protein [Chitinophaga sp. CB10]
MKTNPDAHAPAHWIEKKWVRNFLLIVGIFSSVMFLASIGARLFASPESAVYEAFGSTRTSIQNLLVAASTLLPYYAISKQQKARQEKDINDIGR